MASLVYERENCGGDGGVAQDGGHPPNVDDRDMQPWFVNINVNANLMPNTGSACAITRARGP